MTSLSGSIFKESLKAFLELRAVVHISHDKYIDGTDGMDNVKFDGTAHSNQTRFLYLAGISNDGLGNSGQNKEVLRLIHVLSKIGLVSEEAGTNTLSHDTEKRVNCTIYSLTNKGLELALQWQSIDENEKRFREQSAESEIRFQKHMRHAYFTIAVAIIVPVITSIIAFQIAAPCTMP